MDTLKDQFVKDLNGFDGLISSKLGSLWKIKLIESLQGSDDEIDLAIQKDPNILKLMEEGDKKFLSKYGLEAVTPERIVILDFEKFKKFVTKLNPEKIEDSGPRKKNEFRYLFRNNILIGITNQLSWLGDISNPDSLQTQYLLDLLHEWPSLKELLIEKNLNQDDSFEEIDKIIDYAKKGILQEYKQLKKKLVVSEDDNMPYFYQLKDLSKLYSGFAETNTWEYNNEVMGNRISRLANDLLDIQSVIKTLEKRDESRILLPKVKEDFLVFIDKQKTIIPWLIEGLDEYPAIVNKLKKFQSDISELQKI